MPNCTHPQLAWSTHISSPRCPTSHRSTHPPRTRQQPYAQFQRSASRTRNSCQTPLNADTSKRHALTVPKPSPDGRRTHDIRAPPAPRLPLHRSIHPVSVLPTCPCTTNPARPPRRPSLRQPTAIDAPKHIHRADASSTTTTNYKPSPSHARRPLSNVHQIEPAQCQFREHVDIIAIMRRWPLFRINDLQNKLT